MARIVSINWKYLNYGAVAQLKTDKGFYTICADEDRCGEPLFLEFHTKKDNYCEKGAVDLTPDDWLELEDLQIVAENHYKTSISGESEVNSV